jgi:hypothetical protein
MIFLQLSGVEKVELINQLHEDTNLPQPIIEKDIWVTAVLKTMIYGETLPFNKLIDKIKQLNERINSITLFQKR